MILHPPRSLRHLVCFPLPQIRISQTPPRNRSCARKRLFNPIDRGINIPIQCRPLIFKCIYWGMIEIAAKKPEDPCFPFWFRASQLSLVSSKSITNKWGEEALTVMSITLL
jgi:hypothetical protein